MVFSVLNLSCLPNHLSQVALHILHYNKNSGFRVAFIFTWGQDQVEQLGGELIIGHGCEVPHNLNFPRGFNTVVVIVENAWNEFNCYH